MTEGYRPVCVSPSRGTPEPKRATAALTCALALALAVFAAPFFGSGCGSASSGGDDGSEAAEPSPSASASDTSSPQQFPADVRERLEAAVAEAMAAEGAPGVVAGVWWEGHGTWVFAGGVADEKTGEKMRPDLHMRMASNTKTFTATVVLQLAEEGRLSLDDCLDDYVDGVSNGDRITIRQLLNMSSGVFSFTEDEDFDRRFSKDPLMKLTPEQAVAISQRHDPYFPPGEGCHYSDTNYILLGMIVEQVTGNDVGDEITTRTLEPLQLEDTSFPTTPAVLEPHPVGYVSAMELGGDEDAPDDELIVINEVEPSVSWAAGCMTSTLEDLRDWAVAAAEGSLLTPAMQEERLQGVEYPDDTWDMTYGLGILTLEDFVGHTGAIYGYNSVLLHSPERDATVVVWCNKSSNESGEAARAFLALADVLWPETFAR